MTFLSNGKQNNERFLKIQNYLIDLDEKIIKKYQLAVAKIASKKPSKYSAKHRYFNTSTVAESLAHIEHLRELIARRRRLISDSAITLEEK